LLNLRRTGDVCFLFQEIALRKKSFEKRLFEKAEHQAGCIKNYNENRWYFFLMKN